MAALRQASDLRIAAGEGNLEVYEFQNLIQRRCPDVPQPDVTWCGGISGLRRVALRAQENHLCLLYTSPSPRDGLLSRMPSSA